MKLSLLISSLLGLVALAAASKSSKSSGLGGMMGVSKSKDKAQKTNIKDEGCAGPGVCDKSRFCAVKKGVNTRHKSACKAANQFCNNPANVGKPCQASQRSVKEMNDEAKFVNHDIENAKNGHEPKRDALKGMSGQRHADGRQLRKSSGSSGRSSSAFRSASSNALNQEAAEKAAAEAKKKKGWGLWRREQGRYWE